MPLRRPRKPRARGAAASSSRPSSSPTTGPRPTSATSATRTTRTRTGAGSPAAPTSLSKTDYDLLVANSLSETAFQSQIENLARLLRYLCYHTLDSRGSERGFPDLTILGHGRLILMELKRQDRKAVLTTEQVEWLDEAARLRDSGDSRLEVYGAVRPIDSDRVTNTLYGPLRGSEGPFLHQWHTAEVGCERCDDERSRAKLSPPKRRRRR